MKVEVFRLRRSGRQEVVASCTLVNNSVEIEGNERLVHRLNTQGILDRSVKPPEKVFPKDGRRFLEVLQDHFDSGYLLASEVDE